MSTPRRTSYLSVAAAGLAALCSMSGCSSSSPSAGHETSRAAATPAGDRNIAFSAYSDDDGPVATVVVSGAVGDYGRLVSVLPNGRPDPTHDHQLAFELRGGTFRVDISGLGHRLAGQFATFPPDRTTCSGRISVGHTAAVVPGRGTGRYAGLRGSLTLTVTIDEVDARGKCGPSSPFLAQNVIISGTGTVRLAAGAAR